jgi:hypothetical protein
MAAARFRVVWLREGFNSCYVIPVHVMTRGVTANHKMAAVKIWNLFCGQDQGSWKGSESCDIVRVTKLKQEPLKCTLAKVST